MTDVLVVDDHPLFRRGLVALLRASGYTVVGEAAGGSEAIALAGQTAPGLILMDLGLPDMPGYEAIARILAQSPQIRIVVISMYDDEASVRHSLAAGALGYVVKDSPTQQVLAAVQAAEMGASLVGSGLSRPTPSAAAVPAVFAGLAPRERSVAEMLAQGLTNRLIAGRLGIGEKTVSNYVSTVLLKLGAADRHEAARKIRESSQ